MALCCYLSTITLALVLPRGTSLENSESLGITSDLLSRFRLMAQYSAAAYCLINNNGSTTKSLITCPKANNCPLVEAAGAHGALEFQNNLLADDTGFIAVDDTNKLIVLAFRGTESLSNWNLDLKVIRVETEFCEKCHAHKGFYVGWQLIQVDVEVKVAEQVKANPGYRLVVTGHSLGAALATLAAGHFRKNEELREKTELYTFGSPRVGNKELADFLTTQSDLSYRVTYRADPVVRLPPHWTGYYHMSPEYWMREHGLDPSTDDFMALTGLHNKHGSSGQHAVNFHQHSEYLGEISRCSKWSKDPSGFADSWLWQTVTLPNLKSSQIPNKDLG